VSQTYNHMRRFGILSIVVASAWACCSINVPIFAADLRPVVLLGDVAPGTEGRKFFAFGVPQLSNTGHVSFWAELCCPIDPAGNKRGLWTNAPGPLTLAARDGEQAPQMPAGVTFLGLSGGTFNDLGQVAFAGLTVGAGLGPVEVGDRQGIWSNEGGSALRQVARSNDPAPGALSGVRYWFFDDLVHLNNAGDIVFQARLKNGGVDATNDRGIWRDRGAGPALLARTGDAAPGGAMGELLSSINVRALNEAGQVALHGILTGPGVNDSNSQAIWIEDAGSFRMIARTGAAAPGGGAFQSFAPSAFGDSGQIAFPGSVVGAGITAANDEAVWQERGGILEAVVQEGQLAPSAGGASFSGAFSISNLNDTGELVFSSALVGPGIDSTNNGGIWLRGPMGVREVARKGATAPGIPMGARFAALNLGGSNNAGHLVFQGRVVGPGITSSNDEASWVQQGNGAPRLLFREGDLIDVNESPLVQDFRTISFARVIGPPNDDGLALVDLRFTNFTFGLFLVDVTSVPEPSSASLLVICLIQSLRLSRRRQDSLCSAA
jgi:hypothetical protein